MLFIQSIAGDHLFRGCLYKIMLMVQGIAGDHLCRYCLYKIHAFDTEHCSWPHVQVLSDQISYFWYRALQVTTRTGVICTKIMLLVHGIADDSLYRCFLLKSCFWYWALQVTTCTGDGCTKFMLLVHALQVTTCTCVVHTKIMLLVQVIAGDHLCRCCLNKNHAFGTGHCRWPLVQVLSVQESCFWYRSLQVIFCTVVVHTKIMLLIQGIADDQFYRCCLNKNHSFGTGYADDHLYRCCLQKSCFWYRVMQVTTYTGVPLSSSHVKIQHRQVTTCSCCSEP